MAGRIRGGLGSASMIDGDVQVGALVVANPVGAVTMPGEDVYWAWPFEQNAEFGGRAPSGRPLMDVAEIPGESRLGANTTLAVVATNVTLDKAQAKRVAIMAHDGLARAIRPLHTAFDGDTVFVLSTCVCPMPEEAPFTVSRIGMMAADCLSRAVARAVHEAAQG
jgi:L-aminopeptidase/D-esterase-like protein